MNRKLSLLVRLLFRVFMRNLNSGTMDILILIDFQPVILGLIRKKG